MTAREGVVVHFGAHRPQRMRIGDIRALERILTDVVSELHETGGASAGEAVHTLALVASRALGELLARERV